MVVEPAENDDGNIFDIFNPYFTSLSRNMYSWFCSVFYCLLFMLK